MKSLSPHYDSLTDAQRAEVHRRLYNAYMHEEIDDTCYVGSHVHQVMLEIYTKRFLKETTPDVFFWETGEVRRNANAALKRLGFNMGSEGVPPSADDVTQHPRAQVICDSINADLTRIAAGNPKPRLTH